MCIRSRKQIHSSTPAKNAPQKHNLINDYETYVYLKVYVRLRVIIRPETRHEKQQ